MPRILIRAYANDEHYDATPCLCLDLTPELAKDWLARIALVKGLKEDHDGIASLDYWNCEGDFFAMYELDEMGEGMEAVFEALESDEKAVLEPGTPAYAHVEAKLEHSRVAFRDEPRGARIRTDIDMLEVYDNMVMRSAYVKHTSIRLESGAFYLADLARYAGGLKVEDPDEK